MQEMHRRGCPKSIIVLVRYDACDHLCLVLTGALEVEGSRRNQYEVKCRVVSQIIGRVVSRGCVV